MSSLIPRRRKTVQRWEPLGYDDDPFQAGSFMAMKNRCASTETRTWWEWLGREWFVKDIERFDPMEVTDADVS